MEQAGFSSASTVASFLLKGELASGRRVTNGGIVTAKSVHADGEVELSDGRALDKSFREFLPGYAVTSYGSQGKTMDCVLFSDSTVKAATNAQQWYVTISRGRLDNAPPTGSVVSSWRVIITLNPQKSMNTKTPECWASAPQARGLRLEISAEQSLILSFDPFTFAELKTEGKQQHLRLVFATHEISIRNHALRRIEAAMQRLELSFLAPLLGNQRSLIPDGQPVVVELTVTEAKGTEKRDGEFREMKSFCYGFTRTTLNPMWS